MEYTKIEVALEIIYMCIAIAEMNEDTLELSKLIKERDLIYNGNKNIINKVILEYGSRVKKALS